MAIVYKLIIHLLQPVVNVLGYLDVITYLIGTYLLLEILIIGTLCFLAFIIVLAVQI